VAGFGWACFGIAVAGYAKSIDNFSYVTSIVITPLFLLAGTYFPLSGLPEWAQVLGNFNPLHHCVELVRHAAFGWRAGYDLYHLAVIAVFGLVVWRLAIRRMEKRLVL
jgi:lipooligosaccharide transport system permease protein